MALLKDLILDLSKKFDNNELVALAGASSIAEVEVGDDALADIKTKMGGLMSVDAAKNNTDLDKFFKTKHYGTIKGELLGNIDTDLMGAATSLFGEDGIEKLKEVEFTGAKVKMFGELAKNAIESQSGGDEKIKTLNTNLNKQIADGKIITDKLVKDHEKELKKLISGHDSDLINKEFDLAINQYALGDKYTAEDWMKTSLHENIRKQVKSITNLTLSKDKKVVPKNPDDASMGLFIEGKEITTLKGILDPLMKDFIKVNNVDTKQPGNGYVKAKEVKLSKWQQEIVANR